MIKLKNDIQPRYALLDDDRVDCQKLFTFGKVTNIDTGSHHFEFMVAYSLINDLARNGNKVVVLSANTCFDMYNDFCEMDASIMADCFVDFEELLEAIKEYDKNTIVYIEEVSQYFLNKKKISENELDYCFKKLSELAFKTGVLIISSERNYDAMFDAEQIELVNVNGRVYMHTRASNEDVLIADEQAF